MKILIFDIETMANLAYVWGKYEQDVIDFEREWFILCFAYKWYGEKKVHTVSLPDFQLYKKDKENDLHVVQVLWDLFNQADVIMTHNGDAFDIKKVNARFVFHKLPPPSPYKTIDTKKVAKRYFNFNSNKLDDLGRYLGVGRKLPNTGWNLWKRCYLGDEKAWKEMLKYNKQDVVLLENIYEKFKPYMLNHPNRQAYNLNRASCPNCGHKHSHSRGYEMRVGYKINRLQCKGCGRWFYGEKLSTDQT